MDTENKKSERPPFLVALCGLTFVGSTFSFVMFLLAAIFFSKAGDIIIKYSSWHSVDEISPLFFLILSGLNLASLTGAIRMWKLHKNGLFIYVGAQLTLLFFPSMWLGWQTFSVTNAIFTGIFIIGYFLNLKHLNHR